MFPFKICIISSFILIPSDVVCSSLEEKVFSTEKEALSRKLMNDPTVCGPDVPAGQPCFGHLPTTVNSLGTAAADRDKTSVSKNADENLLNLLGVNQHSLSINVHPDNSLNCGITVNITDNETGTVTETRLTGQNRYLRRFDLFLDEDIMCPYKISSVIFGVRSIILGELDFIPVTIILHELLKVDDFLFANLRRIGSRVVKFGSEVMTTFFRVPLTGQLMNPTKFDLVVEIAIEDLSNASAAFFIGQFDEPQNTSYIATADCGVFEPIETANIGFPNSSTVIYVEGEEDEKFKHLCEKKSLYKGAHTDKKRGYTGAHPIGKVP